MLVRVALFGPQAALAATREVELRLPSERATAADVLSALAEATPALRDSLPSSRLAVNHEFAALERVIEAGDEVALVGMVSGG